MLGEHEDATIVHRRGLMFQTQGRLNEAERCLCRSLELQPQHSNFHNNYGSLLGQLGRYAEAADAFRRAIALEPTYARAHANLAVALLKSEQFAEAQGEAQTAIELDPQLPEAHAALGSALSGLGRPMAAVHAFHRALELRPAFRDAVMHLAQLMDDMGRHDAGVELLRRFLEQTPRDLMVRESLLYALHHTAGDNGSMLLKEHHAWSAMHANPLQSKTLTHTNDRSPDRRLRVGYVSADFRDHPTGRFLLPLIEAHDPAQVEVYCYSDVRQPDSVTDHFKLAAHSWKEVSSLADEALAQKVHGDGIDILIDSTGHMAHNRLLTFARKPAPVQISHFCYPGTVAMKAIEYRITDSLLDPSGLTDHYYTEKLIRIDPSAIVYAPITATPQVQQLPVIKNGFLTFGALNRPSKLTPMIISVWARLLAAVPNSRLLLLSPTLNEQEGDEEIRRLLARQGVPIDRLGLAHRRPREDYLNLFNRIDVHLDTFPYNGCTTTCDGLWMGVPTVTLAGQAYASRNGLALLAHVGLNDLIATTPEKYVCNATRLAGKLEYLSELRHSLRARMQASPLMDANRLARSIEAAYRTAWCTWCESQS